MPGVPGHIRLLGEDEPAGAGPPRGWVRRELELPVRDATLALVADVPDRRVRLAEIVPVAYAIDDRLVGVYLRQARAVGKRLYCRKGCAACCRSYLIVFSAPELYYQVEMLARLPAETQRRVRRRLDETLARAQESGLVDRLRDLSPGDKPLDIIEQWWRRQEDASCAFLVGEACGIYPHRFIACREFHSHSPPETCAKLQANRMATPLSLVNVLWQLEQELSGEPSGSLSMPFMKLWAELLAAKAQRTWPAVEMIERLFALLAEEAAKAQRLRAGVDVPHRNSPPEAR